MTDNGQRFLRGFPSLRLLVAAISLCAATVGHSLADTDLDSQRELYRTAMEAIEQGRLDDAKHAIPSLRDYPLFPYLDFELLKAQLGTASSTTVDAYLREYDNTVVGTRVKYLWLTHLKHQKHWQEFLSFTNGKAPYGMHCDFITALRKTGAAEEADRETRELWLTGHSLPKHCDSVLANWQATLSPEESEELYRQRAQLALREGEHGLASYLLRNIPGTEIYQELLNHPEKLYKLGFTMEVDDFSRDLTLLTLKRLARTDFESSNTLWHQLEKRFQFSAAQNFELRDSFARQMIAGDAEYVRDWISANDPNFEDAYLTEWRVRLALKDADWSTAQQLIEAMSDEERNKPDWQYWWARADIEKHQHITDEAKAILLPMASRRGYYSYLAADLLNHDYQLAAKPSAQSELLAEIENRDAVKRARELYWQGDARSANAEWRSAMRSLSKDEQVAAAQLALNWGWPHAAVMTAIKAGEWDDLSLRFPLAYKETFDQYAKARNIDLNWVYAIARQESAFASQARSPVGARGVMQLMPGTARTISRKMGQPEPDIQDLYKPEVNIEMGSYYLAQLLQEFNGNHILATAAYNAGPERVKRVLARQQTAMPADIWIENLPYGETRNYIKNVLAFSVVYGLKLNSCNSLSLQSTCAETQKDRYSMIGPVAEAQTDDPSGT